MYIDLIGFLVALNRLPYLSSVYTSNPSGNKRLNFYTPDNNPPDYYEHRLPIPYPGLFQFSNRPIELINSYLIKPNMVIRPILSSSILYSTVGTLISRRTILSSIGSETFSMYYRNIEGGNFFSFIRLTT